MQLNLFELAEKEILREGKEPSEALIVTYAIKIRRWLDLHRPATAIKIMQGEKVYNYNGKIKTYANRV